MHSEMGTYQATDGCTEPSIDQPANPVLLVFSWLVDPVPSQTASGGRTT
jgi:hypothetical protein